MLGGGGGLEVIAFILYPSSFSFAFPPPPSAFPFILALACLAFLYRGAIVGSIRLSGAGLLGSPGTRLGLPFRNRG